MEERGALKLKWILRGHFKPQVAGYFIATKT